MSVIPGASNPVNFVYMVPQECDSLGTDSITVTTMIAGETETIQVTKTWVDEVSPMTSRAPGPNPAGKIPPADEEDPNENPDGFWTIGGMDIVDDDLHLFVKDRWVQAPGTTPNEKNSPGAVDCRLTGKGDMILYAVDCADITSPEVTCLVPPAPA